MADILLQIRVYWSIWEEFVIVVVCLVSFKRLWKWDMSSFILLSLVTRSVSIKYIELFIGKIYTKSLNT